MKILILTHDTDTNSCWGRYASQLINGLKQKGFIITVLTEKFEGDSKTSILGRGSKVFSSAFKVIPYAREADIIHALDVYPYGIIAWIASKIAGRPLLINLLGTYAIAPFYHRKTRWLSKRACLSASCLIAISNYTKSEFNKILPSVEVEVINPGIDYGKQHVDRSESGQPFILSVGALKKRKGYHIAIEAFAVARRKFPELKYKIIGSQKDIQYFNGLKELTKKLSLENSIEFESNVSDDNLKELYSKAQLFILPSINHDWHFEGFGIVFLEAAAAGLPIIGTTNNGISDAVKDGYNGILVPQEDVEATAEAVIKILESTEYHNMTRNSYSWAQSHSIDKMIAEHIKIYESIR